MQQKLEVAKLDRYFLPLVTDLFKNIYKTTKIYVVDYNRLPLSCIRSVEC